MSKKGRQRRTPEQRDAAKDRRSTLAYLQRIQREALVERLTAQADQEIARIAAETPVSETESDPGSK